MEQNEKWMDELEKLSIKEQVAKVIDRLLLDTSVYARNSFPAEVRYSKNNGARPLYVIDSLPIYLCNIEDVKGVIKLTRFISGSEIKNVSILRDEQAIALYGSTAKAGVIIFSTTNEFKKTLNNLGEFNLGIDCFPPYICGFGKATQLAQLITTPEQNQMWLHELKILPVKEQVKKINERLLNDASEFAKNNVPKLTPDSKTNKEIHPLYVIDGVPIDIEEQVNLTKMKELTDLLSKTNKITISVLEKEVMTKFGSICNMILITTKDKRVEKR